MLKRSTADRRASPEPDKSNPMTGDPEPMPFHERMVCGVCFSGVKGELLITIGADEKHNMSIWDWSVLETRAIPPRDVLPCVTPLLRMSQSC